MGVVSREGLDAHLPIARPGKVRSTAAQARRATRQRVLFLAQLPPPLHGQSLMAMRTYRVLGEELDLDVTHLWGGGASSNADVGRRSVGKYFDFLRLLLALLARLATRIPADLAYLGMAPWSHALWRDAILAMLAKRVANRVVLHVHGSGLERIVEGSGWRQRLLQRMFRDTEIVAITGATAETARRSGLFRRVFLVPNVSPDPGAPTTRRGPGLQVSTLCNLDPRKGVGDFVEVLGAAIGAGLKVRGVIAGGSTAAMTVEHLRDAVAGKGLSAGVSVVGHVDERRKAELLRNSDVLLYLSRHDLAPMAVIEAMSHGCAPIVLDTGGLREMVGPELAHNVLSPDLDPKALTEACLARLRLYSGDHGALARDRQAARARYLAAYSPERFRDKLEEVLSDE